MALDITQTAQDLITDLGTASLEDAQALLQAEEEKGDTARKTVVKAAQERVSALSVDGTPLEGGIPEDRAWAQLLDGDGEPVYVDGQPVEAELIP